MKTCSKCLKEKPLSDFQMRTDTGKLRADCRSCRSEENRKRYHENADTRHAHWEAHKRSVLKSYGLTVEEYDSLLSSQGGCCAICDTLLDKWDDGKGSGKGLSSTKAVIDHDHSTGAVRGILCNLCNSGLGKFKDSVESLEAAIKYLGGKK